MSSKAKRILSMYEGQVDLGYGDLPMSIQSALDIMKYKIKRISVIPQEGSRYKGKYFFFLDTSLINAKEFKSLSDLSSALNVDITIQKSSKGLDIVIEHV